MANAFVQVPPDSSGKKMQTFENTISGNVVEAEAVSLTDTAGLSMLGTAGSANANVLTVQGIASGTAVAVSGTVTPSISGTLTDRSGTVTTGGTSQQIAASNASRKYLLIENPVTATETLFINFTTAASTSATGSIQLGIGGSFLMTAGQYVSTEAVNVTATTTGHAFIAKEG